jgi:hypothetical protein
MNFSTEHVFYNTSRDYKYNINKEVFFFFMTSKLTATLFIKKQRKYYQYPACFFIVVKCNFRALHATETGPGKELV